MNSSRRAIRDDDDCGPPPPPPPHQRYLATWFGLDALTSVPSKLSSEFIPPRYAVFMRCLKLAKITRLMRLLRLDMVKQLECVVSRRRPRASLAAFGSPAPDRPAGVMFGHAIRRAAGDRTERTRVSRIVVVPASVASRAVVAPASVARLAAKHK